ncbi:bifunctional glycosyltransferase family 2 protein/CDP-glycerol:glycerophosphate glycerophosphotransferase [Streptomyces sp. MST-110588]|uniref:bifunctional glycosyltransferase/CDP-glycerol:glycerophosphate glycerophosphotransferase n=1 Tax=Streptomyces sp. MST-110588 TaxID=2833628 RepID=UPI001F5D5D69|nr:bifunctional glycosyltransferase family 2 protein/CDP-glycerol:glycerophosphate glycerophosphotransferase [Streptomyces sp. MST-110588]UNO43322.1 bifunctional glycosyltransferase family 2 protein/CDP-glycerol:glycerophosphate glycerophosphotransferase [Streptomyces sp. MST-110588]
MPPRLSVIVPVYNVEEYLPACLDSLQEQTLREIEIIVVDDGSPDDCAAIAAEYAARDPRFILIRKENAGLGAARNTGLERIHPHSEFIAFVDSDDVIPPDAYRMMLASLDESGSDFVTGNVHHINSTRVWQSPMHRILAGGARRRTHVTEDKRLLTDRIACNKVFRRTFWEKHGLRFPEGVLYEDTPVIVPAQVLADAVDVVSEPTYYWRLRDGSGPASITQRRTEPKAVRDRTAAVESVSRFLAARPDCADLKREYDRTALTGDIRIFLNVLPDGDDEYRAEFLKSVNRYLDQVDPQVALALPARARLKWLLVRKHAMDELIGMLNAERQGEPIEIQGLLRKYAGFAGTGRAAARLPKQIRRIDQDLKMKAPIQEISWEQGKLRLLGHAWIERMDQPAKHSAVKVVQLRKEGSRRRTVLPVRNVYRPQATTESGQTQHNYDWSGWELLLDPRKLRRGKQWEEGTWHVGIGMVAGGLVRKRAVRAAGATSAGNPPYHWLDENHRLLPLPDKDLLKLRIEKVRALVTGYRAAGGTIEVTGEIRESLAPGEVVELGVKNRGTGDVLSYRADLFPAANGVTGFRVPVPLEDIALLPEHQDALSDSPLESVRRSRSLAARRNWSTVLVATSPSGKERRFSTVVRPGLADAQVRLPASLGEGADRNEVGVFAGQTGYLKFSGRVLQAKLTDVYWRDGRFTLIGSTPADLVDPVLVIKARDRFDEKTVPVRMFDDGTFEAEFTPARMGGPQGTLPLKTGRWNFFLRSADGESEVPFILDRLANPKFPVQGTDLGREYAVEARWFDFPQLNCVSDLSVLERGKYRQYHLRTEVYEKGRQQPLRDAVLYISYNGKQYSDSPKAIHEELLRRGADVEHLWVVRDGQVELPDTVGKVRFQSTEWYEALARCRYIVTNAHLPHWVERREGQVIVQTWHGTMLKRIGLDIDAPKFDPKYHERLREEARSWSMLVSSNRFSTPILKRAMAFDGPVVETGYPRNDYLYAPDRDARAREIRAKLGLPEGKKVVLYAPTWRDDISHRVGQFRFDLRLDLQDAERRLGADHVLLVRRHSNIVDSIPGAGGGFVFDVSEYPDIADLYLAADIMITDYSSVMFDYAHLRRPMLFFTYDLEHYRDTLRGFYFDFEQDAPGPLIHTSEELIDAIADIDAVSARYQEQYDRFHHNFCDLDDGQASRRVADLMFEAAKNA